MLAVLVLVLGTAVMIVRMARHGFSARDEPSLAEKVVARTLRRFAVPADVRGRTNPVRLTPEVLTEAKAHFADHCASCHGNDGKGRTSLGQNLYPKAPDMTLAETQSQTDGELFATIENGIRLTGMPAWGDGTPESALASWGLVHFIRHLPKLTPEEEEEMRALNPRPRAEWEAEAADEKFLAGEDEGPPAPAEKGTR
jgi:mono/diheme cytochrome c family protein